MSWVRVCCVQENRVCILEALQVWVVQQLGAVAHVTTVDVAPSIRQLKQHLSSARAVVGINESDLHTCAHNKTHRHTHTKSVTIKPPSSPKLDIPRAWGGLLGTAGYLQDCGLQCLLAPCHVTQPCCASRADCHLYDRAVDQSRRVSCCLRTMHFDACVHWHRSEQVHRDPCQQQHQARCDLTAVDGSARPVFSEAAVVVCRCTGNQCILASVQLQCTLLTLVTLVQQPRNE